MWIIDLVDGMCEYGEECVDWVVYVVLVVDGVVMVGVVVLLGFGMVLCSDWFLFVLFVLCILWMLVSCSCFVLEVVVVVERFGVELVLMGFVGVKVMVVVWGEVDIYFYFGG